MDHRKCTTFTDPTTSYMGSMNIPANAHAKTQMEDHKDSADLSSSVDIDLREIYFLMMHFLSSGPCQKTFGQLAEELLEHKLLPRRYHAWYSRSGAVCGEEDDRNSFHLDYDNLVKRYSHIEKNHLVKLLKQLMLMTSPPLRCMAASMGPTAADVPTLLGSDSFSLLSGERDKENKHARSLPSYLRWPHMQADQVRGLRLREMGGGFSKHHRAPSIRFACYAIAKPSVLVPKVQNKKKLRGHRDAVYCAIFDRSGRYVITGSDDRLVKIWSMETAFCLASCRGHEGDITDLSVNSTNVLVASASNDYSIRVWRLPDGMPVSVLRGHTGAVTAIAFCPRPNAIFQLLSSSDDGTCRIWDARSSLRKPRVYLPRPTDTTVGKINNIPSVGAPSSTTAQPHQILCCAFNVNGTVFVTGSSDTFARVWNTCKPSTDDIGQPIHEIDILAGHENDVNYVQFSGCAVPSRPSPADTSAEDSFPKFRNSWFSHDNIVTCSRDGSAIIWIPRSRRSHGKIGRWIRAYHLKVPPPPMPPQPPRGGPRQRLLPTPRGVNMIVWSLDNRFVLAAIMDNRICVWNANDGSLVHSLAGHTASTYVLDVHPFNPRIAMSAGYDGKTILWDIWEGTPIHVYDIDGRFKLVDGKFSQDGTSIVLSDDVGQIYLLSTGEGESKKDAKYDQFFLGDYRPLTQDAYGNVIDQETQLVPYRRNVQDVLCDSSMLPYPEPYQSMYQRRRLGALGIEWRPSSIQFAIGTDIGIGQEFPILPVPDLDIPFEPLPDYLDALYLEPENDAINDDNDSEYNVTEEYISDEPIEHSDSASSDYDCSEEDKVRRNQKDSAWRTRKRKPSFELNLMTSGNRVKRTSDEQDRALSRSKRNKKLKVSQRTSRKKSTEAKSLRPRRVAARNAINNFSQMTDLTDEEDEDCSAGYSSTSESSFELSARQREEYNDDVREQKRHSVALKASPAGSEDASRPPAHPNLPVNTENKKKLVFKFSLNKNRIPSEQESYVRQFESHSNVASSSMMDCQENSKGSMNLELSSATLVDKELPETYKNQSRDVEKSAESENELKPVTSCETSMGWGKLKLRTSNGTQFAKAPPSPVNISETDIPVSALSPVHGNKPICSESGVCNNQKIEEEKGSSSLLHTESSNISLNANNLHQNSSKKKATKIKIKLIKSTSDSSRPPVQTSSPASSSVLGERLSSVGEASLLEHSLAGNKHVKTAEMPQPRANCDNIGVNGGFHNHSVVTEMPDLDADAVRRLRSFKLKVPSQGNVATDASGVGVDYLQPCTSRSSGMSLKMDAFAQDGWLSASKHTVRPRSSRRKGVSYGTESGSGLVTGVSQEVPDKLNWLLLLQQEEGYRYIPQMGDKVVYITQGHQQIEQSDAISRNPPWEMFTESLRAVEVCEVEHLNYTTFRGSGSSCCKLSLKFLDSTQGLNGEKFQLMLPELNDSPDFVVEKTLYDAAMARQWGIGDKCMVWWRNEDESGVGSWWYGEIIKIRDNSDSYPGSPWERYYVKYENDTAYYHCPWELFEEGNLWVQPQIDSEIRVKFMSCFTNLQQKASRYKDRYLSLKLNEVAQKPDFQNRFPVPLSPDIICGRLYYNNYYRNARAVQHDIEVMLSNAESYYGNNEYKRKAKSLLKWFERELSGIWE